MSDQRTVRIATCRDSAEVAVLRSVLEAHGIHPIIPGEVVGSMAPHLTAFAIPVFVHVDDVVEAQRLIADIRASSPVKEDDADNADEDGDDVESLAASNVAVRIQRRARTGVTVMLALFLGFGTGHMSTGAWKRGIALAAVEIVGIRHLAAGSRWGLALVALAILCDLVGSIMRVRVRAHGAPAKLPIATLKRH
ncbi:MAG TPA: DUF2007 domain-containing protein [Kofleriaceae bacterium]|nr:DUF2007 domain-containing protein [Kofleriaceae bacterium]